MNKITNCFEIIPMSDVWFVMSCGGVADGEYR